MVAPKPSVEHLSQDWHVLVKVVIDEDVPLALVCPVEASGILHNRPLPGYREGQKQSIKTGIVKSLANVSSCGVYQSLFTHADCRQSRKRVSPIFGLHSTVEDNQMPRKTLLTIDKVFTVISSFCQKKRASSVHVIPQ